MKITTTFIISILLSVNLNAQISKYLFERQKNESAARFVERHLADFHTNSETCHGVIEGYWGDESKGKKIMAFYKTPLLNDYDRGTLIVFQPVGDSNHYITMLFGEIGQPGTYYSGIVSVFFMDVDDDGQKEMLIIEKGENRVAATIEEENEEGEIIEHQTTACCEDTYDTIIIKQAKDINGEYLPVIKKYDYPNDWHLEELKTAGEVKKQILEYKGN